MRPGPARPRVVHLRRGAADGSRPTHQPRGHLPDRRRRRTAASTAIPASRNRRNAVMCPKAVGTTTPNRTAASAPRLGTRRGLRSSGWTRSLRLRFCISTNTYSSWLRFIDPANSRSTWAAAGGDPQPGLLSAARPVHLVDRALAGPAGHLVDLGLVTGRNRKQVLSAWARDSRVPLAVSSSTLPKYATASGGSMSHSGRAQTRPSLPSLILLDRYESPAGHLSRREFRTHPPMPVNGEIDKQRVVDSSRSRGSLRASTREHLKLALRIVPLDWWATQLVTTAE